MNTYNSNRLSPGENFLLLLLRKVAKEYKELLEFTRRRTLFKIVEIIELSNNPGETIFAVQLTNKNCVLTLKASEIISKGYQLSDFNEFHADMIREAAKGKLMEFLKLSEKTPNYKVSEKRFDKVLKKYLFTIETKNQLRFTRTAEELSYDHNLLFNLNTKDIYDIGFTQGSESVLKENTALLIAKSSQ